MKRNLEEYDPIMEEAHEIEEEFRQEIPEIEIEPLKKQGRKSKFEEDVHVNGHKEVWGSFWSKESGWGYKCCKLHDKN